MPQVESSNVAYAEYNNLLNILEVGFKNNSVYRYFNVPKDVYEQLLTSDSKGRFMHEKVVGKYRSMQSAPGLKAVTRNVKAVFKAIDPFKDHGTKVAKFNAPAPPSREPTPVARLGTIKKAKSSRGSVNKVKSVKSVKSVRNR